MFFIYWRKPLPCLAGATEKTADTGKTDKSFPIMTELGRISNVKIIYNCRESPHIYIYRGLSNLSFLCPGIANAMPRMQNWSLLHFSSFSVPSGCLRTWTALSPSKYNQNWDKFARPRLVLKKALLHNPALVQHLNFNKIHTLAGVNRPKPTKWAK